MSNKRKMITSEEITTLYGLVGRGIWHLQHVEQALVTLITIKGELKERGATSREEGEWILEKHRRSTLGTSIRIAKEKDVLSPSILEALIAFKEERDWLVHRSVHENSDDLYLENKKSSLFVRINQFSERATVLQGLAEKELEDYVVSKGVSRERLYRSYIQEIIRNHGGAA